MALGLLRGAAVFAKRHSSYAADASADRLSAPRRTRRHALLQGSRCRQRRVDRVCGKRAQHLQKFAGRRSCIDTNNARCMKSSDDDRIAAHQSDAMLSAKSPVSTRLVADVPVTLVFFPDTGIREEPRPSHRLRLQRRSCSPHRSLPQMTTRIAHKRIDRPAFHLPVTMEGTDSH